MKLCGAGVPNSWAIAVRKNFLRAQGLRVRAVAVARWLVAVVAAIFVGIELSSSWFEARLFSSIDRRLIFSVQPGSSPELEVPANGPYDQRLGFDKLPDFTKRLENRQFEIAGQARTSEWAQRLTRAGIFPIYHEKSQAGLTIEGHQGSILLENRYPERVYPDFQSIPPLVVNTLLFIEDRQLGEGSSPNRNPAIEWGRTSKAVLDLAIHTVDRHYPIIGGSTLATQLEKMRHSSAGRTQSVGDKGRQMLSASLRAYLDGIDTRLAEEQIICDYINSIPLAATRAQGEVLGLADGLKGWYGADFDAVNRLLSTPEANRSPAQMASLVTAYRQVLSLFLAMRAPTWYLTDHPAELANQTDRYLRVLAAKGVISGRLRDGALRARVWPKPAAVAARDPNYVADKAPNAIRMQLLPLLGLDNTYALDRLDLSVKTTLDKQTQESATRFLLSLSDPSRVAAAGMVQYQLLDRGNPGSVIYSVTLYEHSGGANLLRVQTDNFNQPLDINQGTKLQLGSTAKLRILINYLQIVSQLHHQYGSLTDNQLRDVPIAPGDRLTAWAINYLSTIYDRSLEPMLEAALQRVYSASPNEAFFTAGGVQRFVNFERSEDNKVYTVSDGFQHSVNLVYIRLLRDIEHYYRYRVPGASPRLLEDPSDPARRLYLARFADMEGRVFLGRFYEKYKNQTPDQALNTLVAGIRLTPLRAAVIYRSVRPGDGIEQFRAFLQAHLPAMSLRPSYVDELYNKYGPGKFSLQDRGYLAHVHPLELWLLSYRQQNPEATLGQVFTASANERQQVYQWLFELRSSQAQDMRIETVLEADSFRQIHRAWEQLGYPFDSLVPSYATAIGVSGDTPAALARLVGIIVNDGVLYPTVSIERLHFGEGTPFDTALTRRLPPGQRVLSPVIARLVRREMIGVVENGTGRRLQGGLKLPNGTVLPVGGKTGTGDNEFHEYGAKGELLGAHAVNRTAAFTFFIGERLFGTVLAFVPGKSSDNYEFTSALAVQILKGLAPDLLPLVEPTEPALPTPARSERSKTLQELGGAQGGSGMHSMIRGFPDQPTLPPATPLLGNTEALAAEWRFPALGNAIFRHAGIEPANNTPDSAARNRANNQQRLAARGYRFRQLHIRRFV